jgi:hypothetical protein
MKLSLNSKQNLQSYGRTAQSVDLGYARNRLASITRKYQWCKRHYPYNPLQCTFNLKTSTQTSTPKPIPDVVIEAQYQTIVCNDGSILTSNDSGNTFKINNSLLGRNLQLYFVSISLTGQYQTTIDINNNNTGDSLFISNDYGNTWKAPSNPPVLTNANAYIWLATSLSGQYQLVLSQFNQATASDNDLYISSDYGNNWSLIINTPDVPGTRICNAISENGNEIVLLTTRAVNAYTYYSSNFGASWTLQSTLSGKVFFSITNSADFSVLTAGVLQSNEIYYSNDKGVSWNLATINSPPSNPNNFLAISDSYTGQYQIAASGYSYGQNIYQSNLYISTNGGLTWNIPTQLASLSLANAYWLSVAVSASGQYMVGINTQTLGSSTTGFPNGVPSGPYYYFTSSDYGVTWKYTQLQNYPISGIALN